MAVYRESAALESIRARAADLAAAQGRVFRREHLREWGIDEELVKVMTRRDWWVRLRHGVYADVRIVDFARGDDAEWHLLQAAASIAALPLPTHAVGCTAALVHGLPLERDLLEQVHLVRNRNTDVRALHRRIRTQSSTLSTHVRTHKLDAASLTVIDGVPSVVRSIAAVTCAAQETSEWALATLDAAAWKSPSTLRELSEIAADWPSLRGIGTVRAMLPLARTGAQTPLETISRYRLVKQGFPEPELQHPLHDRHGLIGYADMAWLGLGVIGEADGLAKYQSRDILLAEKAREDRIRALGYIVVRWTWNEILWDSGSVSTRIRDAASIARRRAG